MLIFEVPQKSRNGICVHPRMDKQRDKLSGRFISYRAELTRSRSHRIKKAVSFWNKHVQAGMYCGTWMPTWCDVTFQVGKSTLRRTFAKIEFVFRGHDEQHSPNTEFCGISMLCGMLSHSTEFANIEFLYSTCLCAICDSNS